MSQGDPLLLQRERLPVVPLLVMNTSQRAQDERFPAFRPGLPADSQRSFITARGLIKLAGHGVDLAGLPDAVTEDVFGADGER